MTDPQSLFDADVVEDPFAFYAAQHAAKCPVHHDAGMNQYIVTAYDEAREVLSDPKRFSSKPAALRGFDPEVMAAYANEIATNGWGRVLTLQRCDPPEHTHYRRMLGKVFTPSRVKALTPRIDEVAHELIDAFIDRGTCEWVSEFALPLPGVIIAEQLGLDRAQYRTFKRWADAMLALTQRPYTREEAIAIAQDELEAQHYIAAAIGERRANPTEDLISALANTTGDDGSFLTMPELQSLMHQLITGGFETTTSSIAHGVLMLIQHPEQLQLLRDQPELMGNAVEEILRFDSPVHGLWRKATGETELAGVTIPASASVMVRYGAANRDPLVFDEPDRFDITRHDAKKHVAFGAGVHFCVGAALARQEIVSSLTALVARLDDIRLAEPLPEPAHDYSVFLRPLKELKLAFTARH
jgi:cytochrome P450